MKGIVRVTLSACYGSLLALGALLLESHTVMAWAQASASDRFWAALVSGYALVLCASGWVYLVKRITLAGFLHAGLMLAIAAMVVIAVEVGQVATPGADNASAWIVADTDLVLFVGGAFAALFGILVMCQVFTSGPFPQSPDPVRPKDESGA